MLCYVNSQREDDRWERTVKRKSPPRGQQKILYFSSSRKNSAAGVREHDLIRFTETKYSHNNKTLFDHKTAKKKISI